MRPFRRLLALLFAAALAAGAPAYGAASGFADARPDSGTCIECSCCGIDDADAAGEPVCYAVCGGWAAALADGPSSPAATAEGKSLSRDRSLAGRAVRPGRPPPKPARET